MRSYSQTVHMGPGPWTIHMRDGNSNTYNFKCNAGTFSYSVNNPEALSPEIETISSSGADQSSFPSLSRASPPTNQLHIAHTNYPISGAYIIEPTLAIPSNSVPAFEKSNLRAESQNGSISMNIGLAMPQNDNSQPTQSKKKAELSLSTHNGLVKVRIAPSTPRPAFRLLATSLNGSIVVYIPRSFHGPVTFRTKNGTIRVADDIKWTVLADHKQPFEKKCFIGENTNAGDEGSDELVLKTNNGSISVFYAEEDSGDTAVNEKAARRGDEPNEARYHVAEAPFPREMFSNVVPIVNSNNGSGVFNNIQGSVVNGRFWP